MGAGRIAANSHVHALLFYDSCTMLHKFSPPSIASRCCSSPNPCHQTISCYRQLPKLRILGFVWVGGDGRPGRELDIYIYPLWRRRQQQLQWCHRKALLSLYSFWWWSEALLVAPRVVVGLVRIRDDDEGMGFQGEEETLIRWTEEALLSKKKEQ